ncbi:U7 small nuclear RNA associated Lsm10 [Lycorma delicatula]|uniref:U7 small nuclear RNA associated Lsm10 n=1 Tax=Lycorma delicatula TaxID=130591 RepID=UPI003F517661
MAQSLSTTEKFHSINGLVCLVQAITGHYTIVDLRNESYVSGKLEEVDGYMNITMSDAIFTDARGRSFSFDQFFVPSRIVRYVHIPERFKVRAAIQNQLKMLTRKRKFENKLTFKKKRAENQQKETLAMIEKLKKERLEKEKQ